MLSANAALVLGLGVALGLMVLVWLSSLALRDASLVDRYWGAGFVLLAWVYWWSAGAPLAGLLTVVPVTLWGMRLSLFLTWRNWGHGEDYRYQEMRVRHGSRFAWVSLWTVFVLQGGLMWLVSVPVFTGARAGEAPAIWLALPGVLIWAVGLVWETVADAQLARFKADPANAGRVMDEGLWHYSRHPNYFGEILVWIGFYLLAAAVGGWWSIIGSALMIFLVARVSGVTLLEKKLHASRPAYRDYMLSTNALIPGRPRRVN